MLNHIDIMGRLTKDPELRYTHTNKPVVSFTVACDRDISTDGKRECDFVGAVAWNKLAEFIDRNFHKGDPILVSGRLTMRNWQDKDGNRRTTAEINVRDVYFCGGTKRSEESTGQRYEEGFEEIDDGGELPF